MTRPDTYDCAPTLTDAQMLDFCMDGYMMLERVVPDEINRQAIAYTDRNPSGEPVSLLDESWFFDQVICNPVAAGAIRSLLGRDFHLPVLLSNHRREGFDDVPEKWHVDGNYRFNHELSYLQVFYYPQDTPPEMGPTEIVPGSHFWRNQTRAMWHMNRILGSKKTAAPAGTIFITVYQIWHRAGMLRRPGVRNLLKYFYWRTTPPKRDWVTDPEFDFANVDYEGCPADGRPFAGKYAEQFRAARDAAEMFYWLCGSHDRFQVAGGQSWPLPADRNGEPYGFPGPPPAAVDAQSD
ncbi:MAG: hypothetical protein CMJ18_10390 [Phycisphaeraceae bacterium]|nr:hypothetical protein [Phycisphaeraceae bacterium]